MNDNPTTPNEMFQAVTESLATQIVFMSCDDHELMVEFYRDICIALRDQIALKLAGHTNEAFN